MSTNNTIYQFCNPCNRERVHKFTKDLEITCIKCGKVSRIRPSREKARKPLTKEEILFQQELITGSNLPKVVIPRKKKVFTIPQPTVLLNMLKRIRV